mgnify:FL=1|jgi:hypothetical protein
MNKTLNKETMHNLTQVLKEEYSNVVKIIDAFWLGESVSVGVKFNAEAFDTSKAQSAVYSLLVLLALDEAENVEDIDLYSMRLQRAMEEEDGTLTVQGAINLKGSEDPSYSTFNAVDMPMDYYGEDISLLDDETLDDEIVSEVVQNSFISDELIEKTLQRCKDHDRYAVIEAAPSVLFRVSILKTDAKPGETYWCNQECKDAEKLFKNMEGFDPFPESWRVYGQRPVKDGYRIAFWVPEQDKLHYPLLAGLEDPDTPVIFNPLPPQLPDFAPRGLMDQVSEIIDEKYPM